MNKLTGLLQNSKYIPIHTFSTLIGYGLLTHCYKRYNLKYNNLFSLFNIIEKEKQLMNQEVTIKPLQKNK